MRLCHAVILEYVKIDSASREGAGARREQGVMGREKGERGAIVNHAGFRMVTDEGDTHVNGKHEK